MKCYGVERMWLFIECALHTVQQPDHPQLDAKVSGVMDFGVPVGGMKQ